MLIFSCQNSNKNEIVRVKKTKEFTQSVDYNLKLYFNSFTSQEGLPSSQIWNIFQDRLGYMWFATSEGIVRYDGYSFYSYYDNIAKGIYLKMASFIFEDSDGTLWVLNGAGYLNKFNRNKDCFEPIKTPFENGWSEQSTHTIIEDSLKNFWIGAYGGLQYWDRKTNKFTTFPISKIRDKSWLNEEKLRFGKMHADTQGNIWIGTRKFGFVKFNIASKSYHCYRFDKENNLELSDWIPDFVPMENGNLLISDWGLGALVVFDTKTEKIVKTIKLEGLEGNPSSVFVRDILDEGNQIYGLVTENDGLIFYDFKANKVLSQYKNDKNSALGISSNSVKCILKDRFNTYWVGAGNLQNASSKFYKFDEFLNDKNNPKSLRNDLVYSLSPSKNNKLLVSTAQGMSVYDSKTQTFENDIDLSKKNEQSYGVLEDRDGTYWLSYMDKIVHFEPETKRVIKSYPTTMVVDKQNNFLKRACRIMQDSRGVIWTISHWGRLNMIDEKNNTIQQITDLAQDPDSKKFVNVWGMIDDPLQQQIIVCTDFGLATVGYANNNVIRKKLIINNLDISKEPITYIFRASNNSIWCLISGKPCILNPNDFSLEYIDLASKFDVNSFKWIAEAPKGTMLLSCFRGIVKYDLKNKKSLLYYTPNVGDNTFDSPSPVANLNNKVFFSGYKGISMIEPEKINSVPLAPNIVIESLKIPIKKDKLIDSTVYVFDKNDIELDYYQNKFSIKYVGIKFHEAASTTYAYRLKGYDEDWIDAETKQEVGYTNLSPGSYTFEVKTFDNPSQIAQINIKINPPFWLTWWAYVIYLISAYSLIYAYIQWGVRQRLQKIKELENIRLGISSNLHDDVGSILSGLAMQSQIMAITADARQKESLLELSNMSHEAMERMRDTVWAIDSRKDKYENLIDRMRAFTEKNLHLKSIKHDFTIKVEDLKMEINPDLRQNIYLIFKEAITNICKHSNASKVEIIFKAEKTYFSLYIKDNGTLVKSENSDGSGLNNMDLRAKKIGATITTEKNAGFAIIIEKK